ncbi:MAG: T9SS type A sorting domain-containing protein [Balneola sp.]
MKKATKLGALSFLMVLFGFGLSLAQVTYSGNGNTGYGDVFGNGSLTISDNGTTITLTFDRASGSLNDAMVLYIDSSNEVNISSTASLTDQADGLRRAISGVSGSDRSTVTFPSGFNPDYAIAFDNSFGGIWRIVESGSHTFIASANLDSTGSTNDNYVLDIDFSEIGMSSDSTFKFVATYTATSGFRSNEAIGTSISGGNPNNGAVTFTGYATYQSQVDISGTAGWRLLSIPKTSATPADISDDGIGAQFTSSTDSATMYTYDDTGSFEAISSSSASLVNGHGLAVYFFNNTTNGSNVLPVTLEASGFEAESDVVVDLFSGASGRYTLVGNPFASNVDLANVSANVAISSNMTFWDNTAGSYTSENISGGLVIQPWQGYWVQVTSSDAGGQLTYGTADKTTSAADTTHFDKVNPNTLRELSFSLASSYNTEKNLKLQIADDASLDFDNYDLLKLGSLLSQNVSAAFLGKMDGEDVLKGVEGIPSSLDKAITLPIMVDLTGESQTVRLSWEGLSRIPSDWSVELHDYETDQSFDLRTIEEYEFEIKVQDSKEKVNPVTVLKSSFNETVKAKSGQSARLGLTITPSTTSVNNEEETKVEGFALSQNYPNPFNPTTTINYSVENAGPVTISVYNLMGQKVAELVNESKAAGSYNVSWNAANAASGMYYYRLEAGGQTMTRKMTLIK